MYSLTEVRIICISMFWSKITTVGTTAGDSSFVPEELQSEDDIGEKARGSNNKWWAKGKVSGRGRAVSATEMGSTQQSGGR